MKMKNISDYIRLRRSIYPEQFSGEEIKKEQILELLENANYAPSHKLTQPWRFKIVSGSKKSELGIILAEQMKLKTAPELFSEITYNKMRSRPEKSSHVIAVCMYRDPKESLPEWEELAAVSMAVQNIWLSAADFGIGMYWATPKPSSSEAIASFLKLDTNEKCLGFLYLGYAETNPDQKAVRTPIEDKTMWL
jgi:nitroreductase